jgi:hypothetical protein
MLAGTLAPSDSMSAAQLEHKSKFTLFHADDYFIIMHPIRFHEKRSTLL